MINNSVMKCCICNNKKTGEFITINGEKYHLCCIEQLKKQKDDVVEYIKKENEWVKNSDYKLLKTKVLLRMLGEIDVED